MTSRQEGFTHTGTLARVVLCLLRLCGWISLSAGRPGTAREGSSALTWALGAGGRQLGFSAVTGRSN